MSAVARLFVLTSLLAAPLQAQSPTGRAAVYACEGQETCSDADTCTSSTESLYVIETFINGNTPGPVYFIGPLVDGARAGLFFERPIYPLHGAETPSEWFDRLPEILGNVLHARIPDPVDNRYIVIRPGQAAPDLGGNRVVTEFLCTQELFP